LPLPLGPMIARYSFRWIFSVTPRSACTGLFAHHVVLRDVSMSMTSAPCGLMLSLMSLE
jgi:hypothetical protein